MHPAAEQTRPPDQGMAALVQRIQGGDPAAEDELLLLFKKRVFAVAYQRTRDRETARDISQDVLLIVLEAVRKGTLREPSSIAGFVYATTRNVVNDYFRNRPRTEPLVEDSLVVPDDLGEIDCKMMVQRLLKRVDATDRKILTMTLVEGYNADEVACQLKLSADAVRQRKCRALKRILERVERKMSQR